MAHIHEAAEMYGIKESGLNSILSADNNVHIFLKVCLVNSHIYEFFKSYSENGQYFDCKNPINIELLHIKP